MATAPKSLGCRVLFCNKTRIILKLVKCIRTIYLSITVASERKEGLAFWPIVGCYLDTTSLAQLDSKSTYCVIPWQILVELKLASSALSCYIEQIDTADSVVGTESKRSITPLHFAEQSCHNATVISPLWLVIWVGSLIIELNQPGDTPDFHTHKGTRILYGGLC